MRLTLALLLALAVLSGCNQNVLLSETSAIEDGKWGYEDAFEVESALNDTLSPLNFYIEVRHGSTYPYQNLIVFFKTYLPNNTYKVDTIDCPLAEKSGRWYGTGLGDMLDNQVMFKRTVQLPQAGNYKFELQHAMRSDTIEEIYDIGLRIEKAIN